jgi:hypothetical protein
MTQITFTAGNTSDPQHPWNFGCWIFPEGHPLAAYERAEYQRLQLTRPPNQLQLMPTPQQLGTND